MRADTTGDETIREVKVFGIETLTNSPLFT